MLISYCPLRVSLVGGGSDYENYFSSNKKFGCVTGFTINKFIYVTCIQPPGNIKKKFRISYSKVENANNINEIQHDIFREALKYFDIQTPLHISTFSDLPSNSGVGSSSAFTVALVRLLANIKRMKLTNLDLIKLSIKIERNLVGDIGGVQDQYWSVLNGFKSFIFKKNSFQVFNLSSNKEIFNYINKNSYLLPVLKKNRSSSIESRLLNNIIKKKQHIDYLDESSQLSEKLKKIIMASKSIDYFHSNLFEIMKNYWLIKSKYVNPNLKVNKILSILHSQNIPSKLLGAGGGGFIYLLSPKKKLLDIGIYKDLIKIEIYDKKHKLFNINE